MSRLRNTFSVLLALMFRLPTSLSVRTNRKRLFEHPVLIIVSPNPCLPNELPSQSDRCD
jgi:hypothetical protein